MSAAPASSLRSFHLVFILIAIMGADLFAGFSIHEYTLTKQWTSLALGVASALGGLGLAAYALFCVRKLDRERIE